MNAFTVTVTAVVTITVKLTKQATAPANNFSGCSIFTNLKLMKAAVYQFSSDSLLTSVASLALFRIDLSFLKIL